MNKFSIDQVIAVTTKTNQTSGKIKSIAQQRSLDTRTVDMIISLTEPNLSILPGDLLHIDISSNIDAQGFWVPRKALVSSVRGLWSLFTVEEIDGEQQLVVKLVEVVHADDRKAFVRGALKEEVSVVIEGVHRLVPGQKVIIGNSTQTLSNVLSGLL